MLSPLDNNPFDIYISPFMTREKPDSNSQRTIMDLSFAKGLSVNDGILKDAYLWTNFEMHYPSADLIILMQLEFLLMLAEHLGRSC